MLKIVVPRWRSTSSNRIVRCHASTQYSTALFVPKNDAGKIVVADLFEPSCTDRSGIIAS
jgi:hypothetical protein